MSIVDENITAYIQGIQPMYDGYLGELQKKSLLEGVPIIKPETARLFSVLLSMIKPEKILEIGCAVGFSSGLMSRYLKDAGKIITIDRFDVMIRQAKVNFKKLGIEDRVTLLEGDARDLLPTLKEEFDVIFLDAAKGQYIQLLPECLRLLKVGGLLLADDILQEGRVAMERESVPRRQRTIHTRMNEFLYAVSNTTGLESSIIPIDNGVVLCYKRENYKEIKYEE